jgi:molybdopterin molybdotransferase
MAVKPGRPVAMGVVHGTPVIGLPGNPVAVYVTFILVVRPLLARLGGERHAMPATFPVVSGFKSRKKSGRREYLRVFLRPGPQGPVAHKHPQDGAGILTSLTETDGLVELGEAVTAVAPGDPLGFLPWTSLA